MTSRVIISAFVIYVCVSDWAGLRASENGLHFKQFCTADPRFKEHLIVREGLSKTNNSLRNKAFTYLVGLIPFVKELGGNLTIQKGGANQADDTFLSIEADLNGRNIPNLVVNVNPKGSFASAYFSIYRELVLAREFLKWIRDGEITATMSNNEFAEIYRAEHKNLVNSLQKDFDLHFGEWVKAEGISTDVKIWQKNELAEVSEKGVEIPKSVKHRIDLLFASYKSWVRSEVKRARQNEP
jgi:hypothetical protein